MLKLAVSALIVTLVVYETSGYTFGELSKYDIDANGMKIPYCEHGGERFEIGESRTHNCEECICGPTHMLCQGIGYKSGVLSIPNCKRVLLDNCCFQFVNTENSTKPCSDVMC